MLITGITGMVIGQEKRSESDKIFELLPDYPTRRFTIDLGKGNKLQIELVNLDDLDRFTNMDSVIRIFLRDIEPLRDSLGDGTMSRRIDYFTDTLGLKKIRIQKIQPKGSSFVARDGDVALLKLEQDTLHILGSTSYVAKYTLRKAFTDTRYYRVSFFLNDIADLATFLGGNLGTKIQALQNTTKPEWNTTAQKGKAFLKTDRSISAKQPAGFVGGGDFLNFRISVDIQNYKQYFVPSFSLGAGLILSTPHFKRDIILSWDPHFFFAKDSQDKLKTFRNDFLTLTWGQGLVKDNEPRKESHLLFIMSLGYLIKREGEYFDKNTFRLGGGRLSLFGGKSKIEPVMYFNNFFKGVTPGLRLIQSF